jgi:hypothetical protein
MSELDDFFPRPPASSGGGKHWSEHLESARTFWVAAAIHAGEAGALRQDEGKAWALRILQVESIEAIPVTLVEACHKLKEAARMSNNTPQRGLRAALERRYNALQSRSPDAELKDADWDFIKQALAQAGIMDVKAAFAAGASIEELADKLTEGYDLLQEPLEHAENQQGATTIPPKPVSTDGGAARWQDEPVVYAIVEYGGRRYEVGIGPSTSPKSVLTALANWERLWGEFGTMVAYVAPSAAGSRDGEARPVTGPNGEERSACVMISVVSAYNSGNPQLEFQIDGRDRPLRYTRPLKDMVALLANVTHTGGRKFTEADLIKDKRFGGNWIVTHRPGGDPKYRNVTRVEAGE